MKINTASFKKDLKKILPDIEVLGEYKTMKTKLVVKCSNKECNHTWSVTPDNLLRKVKYGCPLCSRKNANKIWKIKTKIWLQKNRSDLILIGSLRKYEDKTKWRCAKPECSFEWEANFKSIRGARSGCPKCGIEKVRESKILPEEKFKKWLDNERPLIKLLSYKSQSNKATFQCLNNDCDTKGGKIWETIPEVLRLQNRGLSGCNHCGWKKSSREKRISEKAIRQWMEENKPTIIMGKDYENTKKHTSFTCKVCNYKWTTSINVFRKNDAGCPNCSGNAPVTKERFLERLSEVSKNSIQLIGKWNGNSQKSLFKCLKCSNEWEAQPAKLTSSSPTGCPSCVETGFNRNLPSWIYLMEREIDQQFGITNDLVQRIKFHEREGWKLIDKYGPSSGEYILEKESKLKIWLKEEIGFDLKGKEENWLKNKFKVKNLNSLFESAKIEKLYEKKLISLNDVNQGNSSLTRQSLNCRNEEYPFEWKLLPKTKLEAWENNEKKFFDGKRCRQGHLAPRFVSGPCTECLRINQLKINARVKETRARKIINAKKFKECPECKKVFLITPEMRKDKTFCSKICAGAESKRSYVKNNPELVKEQKKKSRLKKSKLSIS